jgi:hypothetical protein
VAQQAVQVDGDQQLGADPTGLGQPPTLQRPPGQLREGVGGPLATGAAVPGAGGAGQRLQSRQQGRAGLGLQQPIHRHHAVKGRSEPQPTAFAAPLSLTIRPLGIDHLAQMGHGPPELGRIQPPGQLHQHRVGLELDVVGERPGAVSHHPGVRG